MRVIEPTDEMVVKEAERISKAILMPSPYGLNTQHMTSQDDIRVLLNVLGSQPEVGPRIQVERVYKARKVAAKTAKKMKRKRAEKSIAKSTTGVSHDSEVPFSFRIGSTTESSADRAKRFLREYWKNIKEIACKYSSYEIATVALASSKGLIIDLIRTLNAEVAIGATTLAIIVLILIKAGLKTICEGRYRLPRAT